MVDNSLNSISSGNSSGVSSSSSNNTVNQFINSISNSSITAEAIELKSQLDLNSDDIISDQEIIEGLFNKTIKNSNINLAQGFNSNTSNIKSIVSSIDKDSSNIISDIELIKTLLSARRGDISNQNTELVDYILNKNSSRAILEIILDSMDSDRDGNFSNIEVIKALKDTNTGLDASTKLIALQQNQNFYSIQKLLNTNDFVDISKDDNKVFEFLLKARKLRIEDAFAATELKSSPHINQILDLVKAFDSNANGSLTNKEFISGLLTIKSGELNIAEDFAWNIIQSKYPNYLDTKTIIDKVAPKGQFDLDSISKEIASAKQSNSSASLSTLLRIIKENSGNDKLNKLIGLVSSKKNISKDELVKLVLKSRSGEFNDLPGSTNFFNTLIGLSADAGLYQDSIKEIDSDNNGIIDNDEVKGTLLQYSAERNNKDEIVVPEHISKILSTNSQFSNIKKIIETFDSDPNNFGRYTDAEILKGLLKLRSSKTNLNINLIKSILSDNPLLEELPSLLNKIDSKKDGKITEEEYAKLMVAIAKGSVDEIDSSLLSLIEADIPNASFIKETIQSFDGFFDDNPSPDEVMDKYSKLATNASGSIDMSKLSTLSKIIGAIYPGADSIINLYTSMEKDGKNGFSDIEIANGLLAARSGVFGKIDSSVLENILDQAKNPEAIQHTCDLLDTNKDGKISDFEVISNLIALKQNSFADDDLFNKDIANSILESNTNYQSLNRVISKFSFNGTAKPSAAGLMASLLLQEKFGESFTDADRNAFIKAIGYDKKQSDIDKMKAIISPTDPSTAVFSSDDFDNSSKTIKDSALKDKLLKIAKGELKADSALISILRSNSNYDRFNSLLRKYLINKSFNETSLIKVLVDNNLKADAIEDDSQILTNEEKNYFLGLINSSNPGLDADSLSRAINRLDQDGDGIMSESEYSLHLYIFNNKLINNDARANSGISYDFNNDGKVDTIDQTIFDKVTSYLKRTGV